MKNMDGGVMEGKLIRIGKREIEETGLQAAGRNKIIRVT